ncbi:g2066 [Coccomyxa elongata]
MEPRDRWHLVYAIIVLQGLASAVPWNVYVTESEYFGLRVHVPPFSRILADNFENVNLVISQAANLLGFLIYVPCQRWMSMDAQVLHPQILTLLVMFAGCVVCLALQLGGNAVAVITLASQVIIGLTNATIVGGVFAMAAWLPQKYVQGMSLGIGLSGVGVAAISFVTLWWSHPAHHHVKTPAEVAPEAFSYFVLSSIIIAAAVVTYFVFFRMSFVRHHRQPEVLAEWDWQHAEQAALKEPLITAVPSAPRLNDSAHDLERLLPVSKAASVAKAPLYGRLSRGTSMREVTEMSLREVLRRMMGYNIVCVLVLLVTSAAFPGVTSAMCSRYNRASVAPCNTYSSRGRFFGDLFVPFIFLVFNAGDFLGRLAAGLEPWRSKAPPMAFLIAYSAARALLVGGLVLCNVVTAAPWQLPVLLKSDAWPIGLSLVLGLTNGHLTSLAMMHAPATLPRGFARDRCGPILNLALTIGCTLGSIIAFAITYFFQGGN